MARGRTPGPGADRTEPGARGAKHQAGEDAFDIFGGGSDADPVINVQNERAGDATRPGFQSLALNQANAAALRDQLRAL